MLRTVAERGPRAVHRRSDALSRIKRQGESRLDTPVTPHDTSHLMKTLFDLIRRFLCSLSTKTSQLETARERHFHTNNVQ